MEFTETELIYGRAGSVELQGLLYRPLNSPPFPMVIDIHGGAWSSGHLKSGGYYDRKLAEAGICVLSINFRHGPDFHHPAASADIAAAIRFVKSELGIAYSSLGLVGSSSGGHLSLYTSMLPDIDEHSTTSITTGRTLSIPTGVSAVVDFVIALWPVSDPIARYLYVLARIRDGEESWGPMFTPDRLAQGHLAYFQTLKAMHQASIPRLLSAREYQSLPRILIVQPELDLNVPVFINQTLYGALLDIDADATYELYTGVPHGFVREDSPQTRACINSMIDFITVSSSLNRQC